MRNRADTSAFNEWWWTVDRFAIALILTLMFGGLVLAFAASPPIAADLNIADPYHFVKRQAIFLVPAIILMIGVSFLSPKHVRRGALLMLLLGLAMLAVVPFVGDEVKGARRWISIAGFSVQPSEFVKPAFVVMIAWFFSQSAKSPESHGNLMAIGLLGLVVSLLVIQPDIGQTMLIAMVWCALFFLAGMSWLWVGGLGAAGVIGLILAYLTVPHVAKRVDSFLNPDQHDSFQAERAIDSITSGGWLGKGPGEGTVKDNLPDAHTDYIFAVAAEEYGVIICMVLVALFAAIVIRLLVRASQEPDTFMRLGASGLVILFGLQSCINMAVNLRMVPAKGMTLPFVSYGGSSLLSLALGMGFLLALTRRRSRSKKTLKPITFEEIDPSVVTGEVVR